MESYGPGSSSASLLDPPPYDTSRSTTPSAFVTPNSDQFYYLSCFAAGGMSSSIRWFLTPLELVKTQLQLRSTTSSSWTLFQSIYRQQGVPGLFRGVVPTAASYGTQTSIKYGVYEYLKTTTTTGEASWTTRLAAAFCAEAVADLCMCPLEAWKVRVQARSTTTTTLRHWWTPWTSTLGPLWARQVPGTVANFMCFEAVLDVLRTMQEDPTEQTSVGATIVAGYCAGACNAIVSHPADAILSLRASSAAAAPASVASIVATHGLWRLATRGLGPRMLLTSNVIAVQWLLYEQGKRLLQGEPTSRARGVEKDEL